MTIRSSVVAAVAAAVVVLLLIFSLFAASNSRVELKTEDAAASGHTRYFPTYQVNLSRVVFIPLTESPEDLIRSVNDWILTNEENYEVQSVDIVSHHGFADGAVIVLKLR